MNSDFRANNYYTRILCRKVSPAMSAKRKAPAPRPERPAALQRLESESSSSDEEFNALSQAEYKSVLERNTHTLDDTVDGPSDDEPYSEPDEYPVASMGHSLPMSVSIELVTYKDLPKCRDFDPPTPQSNPELKTPCNMYLDGTKFRLQPLKLHVADSPFKLVKGECCDDLHYGRMKVTLVYKPGYTFPAILSHCAITRLLGIEADEFFQSGNAMSPTRQMLAKQRSVFKALVDARCPKLLASYKHGQILVSAVSFHGHV